MNTLARITLATVVLATILPSLAAAQYRSESSLEQDLRITRRHYEEITRMRHRSPDFDVLIGGIDNEPPSYEGNGPVGPPPYVPTRPDNFGICYSCF